MGSSLPMGTSSLGDTEGGRAVDISLPLASAFAVASHAWLSFCSIAFAVHRAGLASARWHAPLLRLAPSSLLWARPASVTPRAAVLSTSRFRLHLPSPSLLMLGSASVRLLSLYIAPGLLQHDGTRLCFAWPHLHFLWARPASVAVRLCQLTGQ